MCVCVCLSVCLCVSVSMCLLVFSTPSFACFLDAVQLYNSICLSASVPLRNEETRDCRLPGYKHLRGRHSLYTLYIRHVNREAAIPDSIVEELGTDTRGLIPQQMIRSVSALEQRGGRWLISILSFTI